MAESALTPVVGNLSKLAVQETTFLCGVNRQVVFLKDELERLQCFLKDAVLQENVIWVRQIRDAAYEAENVIEEAEYMKKRNRLKKGFMGSISRFGVIDRLPESQAFPPNLRKLVLYAEVIKQDPIPVLEKLPCLVVLQLKGYVGQTMSCSAQGFPRLQELKLYSFSMEEWRIEVGAMPRLSNLTLYDCKRMSKLSEGLLHLPSLKELTLEYMVHISRDDSALKELQGKGCKVTWEPSVKQAIQCTMYYS